MTAEQRARRNINPTPEAVFAMFHWHEAYAKQGGGSMDFYDRLGAQEQRYCRDAVARIVERLSETPDVPKRRGRGRGRSAKG